MKRAIPLLILSLTACSVKDGSGDQSSELRDHDGFIAVNNNTSVTLSVDVGPASSVEVFCDDNLLEFIETEVRGDSLDVTLPLDTVISPMATCEVLVTAPNLERVRASSNGDVLVQGDLSALDYVRSSGWGDIFIDGLSSPDLRVIAQSRGRVVMSGIAEVIALDSSGAGGIEAAELVSAYANVHNSGTGDITATVTERATIHIEGEGDVVLHGDPETVEVEDDGCGDVY